MAKKKARVLADVSIESVPYKSGEVVLIDEKLGKAYSDSIDFAPAAVEYAESEGNQAKDHDAAVKARGPAVDSDPAAAGAPAEKE